MLVLTRNVEESLIIEGNIKVTILGVKGRQVKIGVEAPKNVIVDREEIHLMRESSPINGDI